MPRYGPAPSPAERAHNSHQRDYRRDPGNVDSVPDHWVGSIDEAALAEAVDQFTATVTGEFSVEDILRELAQAATRVLQVDCAGVMAPTEGRLLRFVFATSGASSQVERLQEALQNGPCSDVVDSGDMVNIADLAEEGNWPEFQQEAVRLGLRAATSIPLEARGRIWGVLDLYRTRPTKLGDPELAVARRLANLATSYLVVTADRDDARTAQAQLAQRAMHDHLTGLPVRWVFLEQLEHALARLHRLPERRVAVLFLDIDGLKYINDTYGHLAGDRLITTCVARITSALRPADLLARIGGDEFVILCEDIGGPADAAGIAQRILDQLASPYRPDGELVAPSASIGVALTDQVSTTAESLIAHADTAMYAAKHSGRRCYRMFNPASYAAERAESTARDLLTEALRAALRSGELELHYQPILELDPGGSRIPRGGRRAGDEPGPVRAPWAMEALSRWRHPTLGLLTAGEFIPLAEDSGLILELGAWVIRAACTQLGAWDRELGPSAPARVFVNLSAIEFAQPGLPELVTGALADAGLLPHRLTLEITETELFTEPEVAARAIASLEALGCEIAIDDFGTGYSSLSRLIEIPARTLKVDQSFTRGLDTRPGSSAVISSILLLGASLARTVVVEGVEDAATLAALRSLGATHVQGYLLGRPAPPAEALHLLSVGD